MGDGAKFIDDDSERAAEIMALSILGLLHRDHVVNQTIYGPWPCPKCGAKHIEPNIICPCSGREDER